MVVLPSQSLSTVVKKTKPKTTIINKYTGMTVMITIQSLPTYRGHSRLLARWPETLSRILSGIRRAAQTVLVVYLKHTCFCITSASSALRVLNDYALYKSRHARTHSFIHSDITIQHQNDTVIKSARRGYMLESGNSPQCAP